VDPQKKSEAVEKARKVLQLGHLVLVFIEGQVSLDPDRLQKGKTGAARLALLERVPVIPAAITRGPHLKGVRKTLRMLRRTHIKERLEFGPPMDFSSSFDRPITYELLQEVTRKIMLKLSEMTGKTYDY
ncbi:MAG: 1-acyl-sn-glycerol-3-phosphate acyltransferase, partial [Candidatus Kerfeldbacteria bacterium]|nr:1-acyl-sn-glycerol-3-phosphate acyltransferase [Candidatus Kerfeldbacteria bacterium]